MNILRIYITIPDLPKKRQTEPAWSFHSLPLENMYLELINFETQTRIDILSTYIELALRWTPQDLTDD